MAKKPGSFKTACPPARNHIQLLGLTTRIFFHYVNSQQGPMVFLLSWKANSRDDSSPEKAGLIMAYLGFGKKTSTLTLNLVVILFLFMIYTYLSLRRVSCQNMLERIRAKSGEKKCLARKSRKREEDDDYKKEIAPRQTPKRSSKKRQSHPILNSIRLGKNLPILLYQEP